MSLGSAVLALLVSLALMSAGSLFLLEETRLAENAVAEARASGAAELAVGQVLETWNDGRDALHPYPPLARPLGGGLFLVDVVGTAADTGRWPGGHSRAGLLVRLVPPAFPGAALVSAGRVTLSPGASIEGPLDSGASGTGLTGELDLGQVASMAGVTLPGGTYTPRPRTVGGNCQSGDPLNWGVADGNGACGQYLPVVHIQGDADLDGGEGAGVILVDGDLVVRGAFTFRGVVLARGALVVSGSGTGRSHLYGSVVTLIEATGDSSMWITYGKSIVDSVLCQFGRPEKLRSRSWTKLF
jgi:hypothetical protein